MIPADVVPLLAILVVLTRELIWLAAVGIALSSLDDLAIDVLWLWGVAFRRRPQLPPAPAVPGRFAILVPAWDESRVIGPMLARLTATLDHPDWLVFVGTYPNDPATRAAVLALGDPRIVALVTDRPGPTTKADCLNQLWQTAVAHEGRTGQRWKAIVLHDAEDVVHPQSLTIYDRHMPGLAMVQLPVLPLQDKGASWVSGHYCDEFAESHAKDMMVRALLAVPVPSAGVGTAICRELLGRIAAPSGAPFDASSLTEDYEIGHHIHRMGGRARLLRCRIEGELVATRAFFPATIETAVRQKTRWLTGIALSGWDRLGWEGGLAARWMLARDRKGLLTAAVSILGYAVALLLLAQVLLRALVRDGAAHPLPPLMDGAGPWLPLLLLLNLGLLGWRLLLRAGFTGQTYGWREGLLAVPRAPLANAINFLAAFRASDRYRETIRTGASVAWDKTEHRFPTNRELQRNG